MWRLILSCAAHRSVSLPCFPPAAELQAAPCAPPSAPQCSPVLLTLLLLCRCLGAAAVKVLLRVPMGREVLWQLVKWQESSRGAEAAVFRGRLASRVHYLGCQTSVAFPPGLCPLLHLSEVWVCLVFFFFLVCFCVFLPLYLEAITSSGHLL